MTAPTSITAMPKWKKYVLIGLILVAVIGSIYFTTRPVKSFVTGYATTRTCDFVTVANLTGVFCNDGSIWQVTANSPLSP